MPHYPRQEKYKDIISAMRKIFQNFPEAQQEVRYYGIKRVFPNGMRCDILCYKQKFPVLRISRGAWIVRQNPFFGGLFDETMRVISKIDIHGVETIEDKALTEVMRYLSECHAGVGVLE